MPLWKAIGRTLLDFLQFRFEIPILVIGLPYQAKNFCICFPSPIGLEGQDHRPHIIDQFTFGGLQTGRTATSWVSIRICCSTVTG